MPFEQIQGRDVIAGGLIPVELIQPDQEWIYMYNTDFKFIVESVDIEKKIVYGNLFNKDQKDKEQEWHYSSLQTDHVLALDSVNGDEVLAQIRKHG